MIFAVLFMIVSVACFAAALLLPGFEMLYWPGVAGLIATALALVLDLLGSFRRR